MLNPSEKAAASRILAVLGRHTFALKLTGAYAADSHRPLELIASELEAAARAERIVLAGDLKRHAVRLAFQQSAKQLPDDAITLFALFAVFRTTDVGRNAILEVAKAVGIEEPSERVYLLTSRALVDAHLNDRIPIPGDRDRLTLHPILLSFAEDLLSHLDERQQFEAYYAAAQYYAEYVHFVSDRWFAPDEENILGTLEWAHQQGEHELEALLCDGLHPFWQRRGRAKITKLYLLWGKEAAESVARNSGTEDDQRRAARLGLGYGAALAATGQLDDAEHIFAEGLELHRRMGDRSGEGVVLMSLGLIAQARGRLTEASEYFEKALAISTAANDESHRAANLMYLGQIAQAQGRISDAEARFEDALALFRTANDSQGLGADLASLAQVQQHRGHWREAEALFQQSLSIRRENEDLAGEASVLSLLGQLCLARGDLVETEEYLKQSLDKRREVDDRLGEAADLSQFGRLFLDRGDFARSKDYFQRSLATFRDLHARAHEGVVLSQLGLLAIERNDYSEAKHLIEQSLVIRREVQDLRGEGVDLALHGRIALEQNDLEQAELLYMRSLEIAHQIENRRGEGVNQRQLGTIAKYRHQLQHAEKYYRASLAIAHEVENGLDIADASLALGILMCEEGKATQEGCNFLHEAKEIYDRMQVPSLQLALDAISRFACAS